MAFVRKSVTDNKPFFAFVALTDPHLATLAQAEFAGKTGKGAQADVLPSQRG